jgi:hypothetical protein
MECRVFYSRTAKGNCEPVLQASELGMETGVDCRHTKPRFQPSAFLVVGRDPGVAALHCSNVSPIAGLLQNRSVALFYHRLVLFAIPK